MTRRTGVFVLAGLVVAFVLALGVSRLASSEPDGLNRVAADQGFAAQERPHATGTGPFADYATSGIEDDGLGTGVAGMVGVVATFGVAAGAVWAAATLRRHRPEHMGRPGTDPAR